MAQPQTTQILASWAKLFREEGDVQTADAIEGQLRKQPRQRPTQEHVAQVREALAQAGDLEREGHFSEACDHYVAALELVERDLGPLNIHALKRRFELARCRLNDCDFAGALHEFSTLLRLAELGEHGGSPLARSARRHIQRCSRAVRDEEGGARLQAAMRDMLRSAVTKTQLLDFARAERLRALALRAGASGRRERAVRLLKAALGLRLRDKRPDDELAYCDIDQYIDDLFPVGEPQRALDVAKQAVMARNRLFAITGEIEPLLAALDNLCSLMFANGIHASARATYVLMDNLRRGERTTGWPEFSS
jgi:tetratricopeptide (TPR) repeat protein